MRERRDISQDINFYYYFAKWHNARKKMASPTHLEEKELKRSKCLFSFILFLLQPLIINFGGFIYKA